MERIFEPVIVNRTYNVFDGKAYWTIEEVIGKEFPFKLVTGPTSLMIFKTLQECIGEIKRQCKPPFVGLTLKDFRVTYSNDHAVNYGAESHGCGFTFLCSELKFSSMGTRYNSAAEVIAAINEKRRKEYDANR